MAKARRPAGAREGKRQFLVHIDAGLIRRVKVLAIDRDVTASSVVQEALLAYLPPIPDAPKTPDKSAGRP